MATRAAEALLYDSEAILRLVDQALDDMQVIDQIDLSEDRSLRLLSHDESGSEVDVDELHLRIQNAAAEIEHLLEDLRRSRSVLERSTHHPGNGETGDEYDHICADRDTVTRLEKAMALVDRMASTEQDPDDAQVLKAELSATIFTMLDSAQQQEVTAQQLYYAASALSTAELRLAELSRELKGTPAGPIL